MVFSSLFFLYIFLPCTLILYYLSPDLKLRNLTLMLLSLLFYAWGEPVWVFLLIFSALASFYFGRAIENSLGTLKADVLVCLSVGLSIGTLVLFKYSGLLISTLNQLTGLRLPVPAFSLPIGISFYTFQILSYTLDVYRKQSRAQQSFINFLLFVSLFPQLIAGPILRYSDIDAQLSCREHTFQAFSYGVVRFISGLAKKVILANHAGELADQFLGGLTLQSSTVSAWFGLIMFTLQIYFDFSGYSDMAIGLGKMFGFTYKENFDYPYTSTSVTQFWRRWHISLGSFFRDYLYIPLGGSRRHQIRNIAIVWALTGIWHGASWNFLLWGLYYGVILILEKMIFRSLLEKLPRMITLCTTQIIVMLGWVLFYFTDPASLLPAFSVLFGRTAAFTDPDTLLSARQNFLFLIVAIPAATPIPKNCCLALYRLVLKAPALLRSFFGSLRTALGVAWILFILYICTCLLNTLSYNPFLYFRF